MSDVVRPGRSGDTLAPSPVLRRLLHVVLLSGSVVMLLPFVWMVSTSLKQPGEVFAYPVVWLPERPVWRNYADAMASMRIGRLYANSLFVAIASTVLELLTASLAAFAFARLRFRGRDTLFVVYLATLMIPGQIILIPSFIIIRALGWYDSYAALIVPAVFSAFSTFFLRQAFRGIPLDLDDAARIDGATSFRIWWRIMLPLAQPALATLGIFSFLGQWNSFLWPLIVTSTPELRTIPLGLAAFQGENAVQWHLLMAGTVVALGPVLAVYIVGQRYFVRGLSLSARG